MERKAGSGSRALFSGRRLEKICMRGANPFDTKWSTAASRPWHTYADSTSRNRSRGRDSLLLPCNLQLQGVDEPLRTFHNCTPAFGSGECAVAILLSHQTGRDPPQLEALTRFIRMYVFAAFSSTAMCNFHLKLAWAGFSQCPWPGMPESGNRRTLGCLNTVQYL